MVVHANHRGRTGCGPSPKRLRRLVDAGIPVLNQSVLLRGVNDAADTLVALSLRLLDLRVMPYYLHQLDQVAGAAHFHVPIERGRAAGRGDALRSCPATRCPGMCVKSQVARAKRCASVSTPVRAERLSSRSRLAFQPRR